MRADDTGRGIESFGDPRNGNNRTVAGKDRGAWRVRYQLLEHFALEGQLLRHRLGHVGGAGNRRREIGRQRDQVCGLRIAAYRVETFSYSLADCLSHLLDGFVDVYRVTRRREDLRNARAHQSAADDCDFHRLRARNSHRDRGCWVLVSLDRAALERNP